MAEIIKELFNVTLKPKELEKSFRDESITSDKSQTKIIMTFTLILIILFIGLDTSLLQENKIHPIWIPSRVVASIASLIAIQLVHKQSNAQKIDHITLVWELIFICHLLIINSTRINDYVPVIVWDILTIFGIYYLIPLPYHYKIFTAFILTACSGAIWYIYRIPIVNPYETVAILAAYLMTNIFGVLLSRLDNKSRRQYYVLLITDSHTGISNRRHFFNQLPRELERTIRYGNPLSIVLFDLDNLKEINDKYGHDAGDELIRVFAKHCSSQLRTIDHFARFGGDEFIALLVQTDEEDAKEVAERIRKSVEDSEIQFENAVFTTTVSIGLTTTKDGMVSVEKIIKNADRALYEAKHNGRNQVAIT